MLRKNAETVQPLKREFRRALRLANRTIGKSAVAAVLAASICSMSIMSGCTRGGYRAKTDTEAYYLLDQKVAESCEVTASPIRIELDSRSRMFDPFNPDRQPMPEDDPQSNQFMRMVDGKKGYPLWEANGRTNIVENPQWWTFLPLDERGVLVLDLEEAVKTALLHSPAYQRVVEEMYLSAIDVSSERFLFDSQFFNSTRTSYQSDGPFRTGATAASSSVYAGSNTATMRKQFSTGATLITDWANSLTWQLAGPNNQAGTGILDFTLIQPLLRQGGRDVVLERLTLAERTLLANVRSFERYRRGFYLSVATGQNIDTTPARRGGVLGGAGFANFSGLGGGFGNLGGGGGGGGGGAGTAGVPGANGYLGLLQDQLSIANQEETVAQLTDVYLQLRDNYRELLLTIPQSQQEIPSQQLQVVQAQQRLYDFQTNLLQLQVAYQQTLDGFKATLGLPPYLCVEIRDPLLDQFRLVSQELRDRRSELTVYRATIGGDNTSILALSSVEEDQQTQATFRMLPDTPELTDALETLKANLGPIEELQKTIVQRDIAQIRGDIEKLRSSIPVRRKQLNRLLDITKREQGMTCTLLPTGTLNTSFLDGAGLEKLPDELENELQRFETRFEDHTKTLEKLYGNIDEISQQVGGFKNGRERFSKISDEVILGSQDLIAEIGEDILALQLIQARARTEAALLPEVDLEPRDALEIARTNRRDWLNNRASLVNSWRSIEFVADSLESVLDFTVSGDVVNTGDNPLSLRSNAGRLRVGLQWDAPITRLQERNNYRQSLIEYQRAKRSYYQYEDAVWTTMRSSLRAIRQNQLSFEIQRFAVQTATQQISINEDLRSISETLGTVSGPTAARDATQALQDLLSTQNQLIGIFVNYEAQRRGLDLNLGTMQLDSEGIWIDPGAIRLDTLGGGYGDAVYNYGLTESEIQLREEVQAIDNQPIEMAPTSNTPPLVAPNNPDFPGDFPGGIPLPNVPNLPVPPPAAGAAIAPRTTGFSRAGQGVAIPAAFSTSPRLPVEFGLPTAKR